MNITDKDKFIQRLNTGKWTNEEHSLFLEGFFLYGHNWNKVKKYVKTRTSIQIRCHYQKFDRKLYVNSKKYINNSKKDLYENLFFDCFGSININRLYKYSNKHKIILQERYFSLLNEFDNVIIIKLNEYITNHNSCLNKKKSIDSLSTYNTDNKLGRKNEKNESIEYFKLYKKSIFKINKIKRENIFNEQIVNENIKFIHFFSDFLKEKENGRFKKHGGRFNKNKKNKETSTDVDRIIKIEINTIVNNSMIIDDNIFKDDDFNNNYLSLQKDCQMNDEFNEFNIFTINQQVNFNDVELIFDNNNSCLKNFDSYLNVNINYK